MVKRWTLTLLLPLSLYAGEVSVTLDESRVASDATLDATLTVTHAPDETISAFSIQGKPLNVRHLKTMPLGDGSTISLYHFSLPTSATGLQTLPPISVQVGNQQLQSSALTYEVVAQSAAVTLKLEGFIEGRREMYPGQTRIFGYRYTYTQPVELTHEYLPLLEPEGFKRIGSIQVARRQQGNIRISEISQQVKALEPGRYSIGPSYVEGKSDTMDKRGQRLYNETTIHAETPAITITVKPFPDDGKPPSFNGAIGHSLTFKVQLLSYPEVRVDDKMTLAITISGTGNLSDIPLPELCCQPGFPGNFKLDDIPPAASMNDGAKVFVVELRPLSTSLTTIPPIYFSYFNPNDSNYTTLKTDPIPITVLPIPKPKTSPTESIGTPQVPSNNSWPTTTSNKSGDNAAPLSFGDLFDHFLSQWVIFFLIPFAIGFIIITYMRRSKKQHPDIHEPLARDPLDEAFAHHDDPTRFFSLLNAAFLTKLEENGQIPTRHIAPQQLPEEGISGAVRTFLCAIEKSRFTGQETITNAALRKEAEALYQQIGD